MDDIIVHCNQTSESSGVGFRFFSSRCQLGSVTHSPTIQLQEMPILSVSVSMCISVGDLY